MFAGCDQSVVDVLISYGEQVGVAFQLADDVIDLVSDGAETGKTPGTDLREGVPTLPVLLARRAAPPRPAWWRCWTATCPTTPRSPRPSPGCASCRRLPRHTPRPRAGRPV